MKYISLTKGARAIVDDEDFDYLNQWKWCLGKDNYAVRSSKKSDALKKRKTIFMHLVIQPHAIEQETDHINGNSLDNRRSNLRAVSPSVNRMNVVKSPFYDKSRGKWGVALRYNLNGVRKRFFKRVEKYSEATLLLKEKALELQHLCPRNGSLTHSKN